MAKQKVAPVDLRRAQVDTGLQKLAKLAPTSLAAHAALFFRDDQGRRLVPARHHREWLRMLEDRRFFRWVVIVAPPAYAKSRWVSIAYVSQRIGVTKGKVRIGLVSNTGDLAQGFGKSVAEAIENPLFEQLYGVKPDLKRGWNLSEMWTTGSIDASNPNLHCVGVGGNVQGHRYDEIILDDPSTWEDVRSETTIEGQRFFVKSTLLERFPPGFKPPDGLGRCIVVLTRWGERDLVETFRSLGFKIVTMPVLGYWDRIAVCPVCNEPRDVGLYELLQRCEHCDTPAPPVVTPGEAPLWPENESREALLAQREDDPIVFDLVKQGDPQAVGGNVFDVTKINHARLPARNEFEKVVQYVDTAGGKDRKRGDYFAIVTLGTRKQGREVWALDVYRAKIPAPEQEEQVIRKGKDPKLQPNIVFIENKNEGIALYQRLLIASGARLPIQPVDPRGDKEFRAIPLASVVNAGRFYVPVYPNGEAYPWVRPFEMELAAFPTGRHDDQVDAAAGAYAKIDEAGPRIRVLTAGAV